MERSTVHTLLHDLAESPAPPSTVDIRRAASVGRRTVRLRRALTGGSAAIAVVALTGVLGVLINGGTGSTPQPGPIGTASQTPPPDRPMPERAPTAFDPMMRYAEFGWLPDGVSDLGFTATADSLRLDAVMVPGPGGDGESSPSVQVIIVTAGHGVDPSSYDNPSVPPEGMASGLDAEPVNDRRAAWLNLDDGRLALRWEYAPGAWAAVTVSNVDDMKDVARAVASDVRFATNTPVVLPFRTTAIPPSLPVVSVQVSRNTYGSQWWATLQYGSERTQYGDWPLSIIAFTSTAETGDGSVIGDPNTTVDGHPARTSSGIDGGSGLQLFNVNGVYLEMLTHSQQATAVLPGGLVGLFRSMEIYPDPANWR